MSLMLILEGAVRSLVMAAIIWLALRGLRIGQIPAQRAAWLLALAGALTMPLLAGFKLGPQLLPAAPLAPAAVMPHAIAASEDYGVPNLAAALAGIYLAVSGLLLLRLGLGWAAALRMRTCAKSIACPMAPDVDVRVSAALLAPVTIASSIVLPECYAQWPADRLRMVISHESAHVRQRDFDVQLLAGVHCALFWFSPFSWWLRRHLADLGEALSDHAAVQHADSHASYAEVLLSFAGGAAIESVPGAAVAMARSSNVSARIERLLSDGFQQCFAKRRRSLLVAAAAAVLALATATSVSRVQAASHGVVHSDDMYGGNEGDSADTPPAAPAPSAVAIPPAPPAAPAAPPAPPAPRLDAHAAALDAYAREMARSQRQLAREDERLAHERTELGVELEQQRSEVDAQLAHARERLAAAERQLAVQMQSPQMKALREQQGRLAAQLQSPQMKALLEEQSRLGRQMSELAEQQVKLIEQAMRQLDSTLEKALRQGHGTPDT